MGDFVPPAGRRAASAPGKPFAIKGFIEVAHGA
jgi:hypothetical protein